MSYPTIDQNTLSWIITSGVIGIFLMVLGAVVVIVRRLTMLADRIKALEDNPLLIAYRKFLILEARRIFDPEEQHKRTSLFYRPSYQNLN
ncbi:MAG TPA: hypothetical protein VE573_06790 [Nitrososphaeraceae archaeon]|nr:hypothetical protein [Nitrososphaeraceae archaeon]